MLTQDEEREDTSLVIQNPRTKAENSKIKKSKISPFRSNIFKKKTRITENIYSFAVKN